MTNGHTRVVFATGNRDKLREIREILAEAGVEVPVLTMKEAGVTEEIDENGTTFEENAMIKARAVAAALRREAQEEMETIVLADDSGLVIDALDGAPGIYSARYLGHDTPYSEKNAKILQQLEDVPEAERSARFVCAIAAVLPDGGTEVTRGVMEGRISHEIAGSGGFGYDPIFYLPEAGKTSAELTEEEKNAVSHRGKALRAMAELLFQK